MNSPKRFARLLGLLYLVPTILGPFCLMYVPSAVLVPGDALATAAKLGSLEGLVRAGWCSELVIAASEVVLASLLFVLMRPAGRGLAITLSSARLAMAVLQAANVLPGLAAFTLADTNPPLALAALELKASGVHLWEVFFGLHCAVLAVAVFHSTFFPRPLGVLLGVAAFGYLLSGFGSVAVPSATPLIASIVGLCALVGEVPFLLWLCIKGVDEHAWQRRAGR